jgi:hypothetical protein
MHQVARGTQSRTSVERTGDREFVATQALELPDSASILPSTIFS